MRVRRIFQAFERTSSVICFVILLSLAVELTCTAYYITTSNQSDFMEMGPVQSYENRLENQLSPDEWTRTTYYWKNNLSVAGHRILTTVWYSGISSEIVQAYVGGLVNTLRNYENTMVPFRAAIEMHGLLELTGFFIITAITARLAWNFWKASGYLILTSVQGSEIGKREFKRKLKKYRKRITELLGDFAILSSIGALLIFLAAPVESYISPYIWGGFHQLPVLAYIFLIPVALIYITVFFVEFRGREMLKKDANRIRGNIRSAFRGKFVPSHLSLLMFIFFTTVTLVVIFT